MWTASKIVRAVAGATVLCLSLPLLAQPTDTAVKAAFLPRFARYVTWPPSAMPRGASPLLLCVIGKDPFGPMLDDAARSQLIDGRRILVRRMSSLAGVEGCQIAFLGSSEFVGRMGIRPVLTVTDAANTSQRGVIHFIISGGRVRFFIDQAKAQQRGLAISSRLLALAVGVSQ
ncbi:MAG TPA: YfiR family protein [Sphingomicrobium sp.]|jgi:hypothetical protein